MKKIISKQRIISIICISMFMLLIVAVSDVAAKDIFKQSDPIPEVDSYGAYNDTSKSKVMERSIVINSEKIALKYARTENLKESPVSKRADSYGTYDVYVDKNQTEYLYLLNTDIYCGFKLNSVGVATAQEDAISQKEALVIANRFLKESRTNYNEYQLMLCTYDELAGYYDIQYYLPIGGYKSDDIFRLWIDAQGNITSFSEFNYKRYSSVKILPEKYVKADQKLTEAIFKETKKSEITVVDAYISIDDVGKLVLIKVIDIKTPMGENYINQRELYSQSIE